MTTQTSAIVNVLDAHIALHKTAGEAWPADALFCTAVMYRTWPCGWDTHESINFFTTEEDFKKYIAEKYEWAKLEDNGFALMAWTWDLGPRHMPEHDHNSYELCIPV